jgi:hypothetical protein
MRESSKEDTMKKSYDTPTLIQIGDAVTETRIGDDPKGEALNPTVFRDSMPGSVGYYL